MLDRKNNLNIKTEEQEQIEFCQALEFLRIPYFAVPNGLYISGSRSSGKTAGYMAKMKRAGVKSGVPDLVIFLEKIILFVEMKRAKGGIVSQQQKEWINTINNYGYAKAVICRGYEEAIKEVKKHTDLFIF